MNTFPRNIAIVVLTVAFVTVQGISALAEGHTAGTVLPVMPVADCRGERAKLYDECGSQVALYETAMQRARDEGKVLLVSYGAEWCIWCHVFESYVMGEHTEFTHTYSDQSDQQRYTSTLFERPTDSPVLMASIIRDFVAERFVLVHIENRYSADGAEVLALSEADEAFWGGLPFIYAVDAQGQFVGEFSSTLTETRRDTGDWYRGYDRGLMQKELQRLWEEAR